MNLEHIYERRVDPKADDSLGKLARRIRPGSTILELGPAVGYFTRYLRESLGCVVDCVEYSAEMAARTAPFAREMWVADLDAADLAGHFEAGSYDYVISADVLEHLKNPWRVLSECRGLLKPGGQFLISIPHIGHAGLVAALMTGEFEYRDEGLLDRTHLRFFTRRSLLAMLRESGYRVDDLDVIRHMPEATEFGNTVDLLPPDVRAKLLSHPDALTYQFIVAASPGEMTDDAIAALASQAGDAEPYFCARLYWAPPGKGFEEERGLMRISALRGNRRTLTFELPDGARVQQLRFDPADRAGYLHLYAMRLRAGGRGGERPVEAIWSRESADSIAQSLRMENLTYFGDASDGTFYARTIDPQVHVQLPAVMESTAAQPLVFEVELDWPASADYVLIRKALSRMSALDLRLEAELRQEVSQKARELDAMRGAIAERDAQIGGLDNLAAEHDRYIKHLETQLQTIQSSRGYRAIQWLRGLMGRGDAST